MNTAIFLEPKGTTMEIVHEAKKRGYRTVALSSDLSLIENTPFPYRYKKKELDEILLVESWLNYPKLLSILTSLHKRSKISFIYSGIDACMSFLTHACKIYGLPSTSEEAMNTILNKYELRRVLRKHNLSGLSHILGREANTWTSWNFSGAAYFKPVHGSMSAYVKKCETFSDFIEARENWIKGNSSNPSFVKNYVNSEKEYHLEEAFDGELLSVESIVQNGNVLCLGLLSRILYSKNPVVEMGSCFPYPHPMADEIISMVKMAHKVLGFTQGATHVEVMIKDGRIEIIDFNPRFVGADVLQSINFAYGINIEKSLVDLSACRPVQLKKEKSQFACLQYFLPPDAEKFNSILFPESTSIKFKTVFMETGSSIVTMNSQADYMGCYLTVSNSYESALSSSRSLRSDVLINGTLKGVY